MIRLLTISIFISSLASAQKDFTPLKLHLPKNQLEPKHINFANEAIYLDDQKCFSYVKKQNVIIDNETVPNYFEISSLDHKVLFSGIIRKNVDGNFESKITFHPIDKIYTNSKVIGRNDLILNLSSNQVINNNCSLNLENLRLFYEKSNENN
ncbi:hypothetical protein J2810_000408 [Chryseobacterium rhizosphaerae]|uniref:hypothetical protein n=1 Tax=Chryseobacterium rhizosphaerae TaxID=395937 RepID=UPI0028604443|nr:hypothetical protein [Chryseobacterium rhizosphaerae]MDR6544386.1 hypothetical protein [Chryseobacterium rhizosphaerae]